MQTKKSGIEPIKDPERKQELTSRTREDLRTAGKAIRVKVPRTSHAGWNAPAGRRDPIEILIESSEGRIEKLLPIRYGRMMQSPFAFYRGALARMAPAWPQRLINTVALARCEVVPATGELFQQFATPLGKPLKRLTGRPMPRHRAEATVLMGGASRACEILCGLVLALALTGCKSIGPGQVAGDRFDYSAAIGDSWKAQTLLNIVKMRYVDPPIFADVGRIGDCASPSRSCFRKAELVHDRTNKQSINENNKYTGENCTGRIEHGPVDNDNHCVRCG